MPILRIPHDAGIDERFEVAGEKLLAGDPRQGLANLYSDASGQFHCGVWEAAPATWRVQYREHEFCHLLAGRIRIRENGGGEVELGPGDSFVVPAGFRGVWEVLEPARKLYVVFEAKTP